MLLGTNRCAVRKALLFFDQSDKSLDSGLRAYDYVEYKCIRRPFPLFSQTKGKKDNLIADYYRYTVTYWIPKVSEQHH